MKMKITAVLIMLSLSGPAFAQGYEGLIASQPAYQAPQDPAAAGYDGVTAWRAMPGTSASPYDVGAPPPDLYSFVQEGALSNEDQRQRAIDELARRQQERIEQIQAANLAGALQQEEDMRKAAEEQQYQQLLLQERAKLEAAQGR